MRRNSLILILLGLAMLMVSVAPVSATDNAKWFVCKYVTTPGGEEVLQSGDNPISVSENAIPFDPVMVGQTFSDAQGRSLVIEEDIGQEEPAAECPEHPPSPTPSPSPSEATPSPSIVTPPPSESPSAPPPSQSPSQPPVVNPLFEVSVCPATETASLDFFDGIVGLDIPEGQSAIRFRVLRAALLITQLNVRIDGVLLTLENTLGDGTVGDRVVSPGTHTWSISNAADTEVLASGEIFCPVCNPVPVPPTAPVPDTALPLSGIVGVVGFAVTVLGGLLLFNSYSVRRRS